MLKAFSARTVCSTLTLGFSIALAVPVAAQNEDALRSFFEGKRVAVKIDMPGTSDGVDVKADASRALDSPRYGDRLKSFGTAIHRGESATVTLIKVKKDLIEFQLNGGGFGTFTDDTSTSVSLPDVPKSSREKELDRKIDDEKDRRRRQELQEERDELRNRRERENRHIAVERARLEELKRQRLADARLKGGSRFNLRYSDAVPSGIRPEEIMAALGEFVDFGALSPRVVPVSPPPAVRLPKKGMSRAEAELAFGKPVTSSAAREGSLAVNRVVFTASGQRIAAEFVEDVLVRYTITPQ